MTDTVYINFFNNISKEPVDKFIYSYNTALDQYNPKNLHILLSTSGGGIRTALGLYGYLKSIPTNVIMHGVGGIDSCGVNVFLAGNERYANPGTSFMLHPSTVSFNNKVSLSINQLKLEVRMLQTDQDQIIENILSNTTYSKEDITKHIEKGMVLNPASALEKNIIQEVKAFRMKPNCPFIQSEKIHAESNNPPNK